MLMALQTADIYYQSSGSYFEYAIFDNTFTKEQGTIDCGFNFSITELTCIKMSGSELC